MKTMDLLLLGGAAVAGIFLLPKLLNAMKGGILGGTGGVFDQGIGGFLDPGGFKEVIDAGGTVETTKEAGLPWWTFISPFSIVTAYGQRAAGTGDVTQTVTPDIKSKILKPRQDPYATKAVSIRTAQRILSKGYMTAPVQRQKVIERIHADLPKTITTVPGQISPYFQKILEGKVKYGTTGGR